MTVFKIHQPEPEIRQFALLKNYELRWRLNVTIQRSSVAARGSLSLMPAAAADATATLAPARLHRNLDITLGVPFAFSARVITSPIV